VTAVPYRLTFLNHTGSRWTMAVVFNDGWKEAVAWRTATAEAGAAATVTWEPSSSGDGAHRAAFVMAGQVTASEVVRSATYLDPLHLRFPDGVTEATVTAAMEAGRVVLHVEYGPARLRGT